MKISGYKTGSLRRTNQKKLKRTQTNLAVRRMISDRTVERYINAQVGSIPADSPFAGRVDEVRITHGKARYQLSRWQRIKNWLRKVFSRKATYPKR